MMNKVRRIVAATLAALIGIAFVLTMMPSFTKEKPEDDHEPYRVIYDTEEFKSRLKEDHTLLADICASIETHGGGLLLKEEQNVPIAHRAKAATVHFHADKEYAQSVYEALVAILNLNDESIRITIGSP